LLDDGTIGAKRRQDLLDALSGFEAREICLKKEWTTKLDIAKKFAEEPQATAQATGDSIAVAKKYENRVKNYSAKLQSLCDSTFRGKDAQEEKAASVETGFDRVKRFLWVTGGAEAIHLVWISAIPVIPLLILLVIIALICVQMRKMWLRFEAVKRTTKKL
jgi:hypothetical protein